MATIVSLGQSVKVINSVSVSASGSTSVDFEPLLGLASEITVQLLPAGVDGLVVKLQGSLDGTNYNIALAEVSSDINFTNKTFGPMKSFRAIVTNYGSTTQNVTLWVAIEA